MEDGTKSESHLTSAAAFVEGGIQDPCDDACSICLEAFSENDPSTVTGCKHEFHLQCILEWCQRSSQCPMCWQSISLKDPSSQELFHAVEQERSIRNSASRSATIFHHPTLGDFELQHLPVGATDAELEERIIQHLAAAAAMGRARHIARREGHRNRSSAQGRPQFLVFSAQSNVPSTRPSDSSGNVESTPAISLQSISPSVTVQEEPVPAIAPSISVRATEGPASPSASSVFPVSPQGTTSANRRSTTQSSVNTEDRAGPSELHSFSESLKSRINTMSIRYKESITKSTRGWKERLFSRNNSSTSFVSEVQGQQGNSDIATLSCMMEHLESRGSSTNSASVSNNSGNNGPSPDHGSQHTAETGANSSVNNNEIKATSAAEPSAIG